MHLVKLWAYTQVLKLLQTNKSTARTAARALAISHQIVTPVTGAVVLETSQQYREAGLQPVDPGSVPTIPEPEIWLLLLVVGILVVPLLRHRKRQLA